jgi:alpha-amylase/alpha-mannosidase (GH57 family)
VNRSRHVVIHGHFYQPPRENPWLERIEVQDSAHPHHDWNARVAAECYGPNTAARRLGAGGRIADIANNFEHISFNVGPTLLAWLAAERPDVHARLVEADGRSRARCGGHGNAIAQAYGHAILPLATRRDKVTHVRWGLADFRHRFGREAEGLWLPETAVDGETLEVLADEGVRFTILAPHQVAVAREEGHDGRAHPAGVDPTRAYRVDTAGGRSLAVFLYDASVSRDIAFGGLLHSGDALAARLLAAFDERRPWSQLVSVATDGESYGHHHRFGEMALAAAIARLGARAVVTNYAAFLAAHPPAAVLRLVEGSSWSCEHGVERWRADCGCRAGHPGWTQRWRAPLREALDWLRDAVDPLFEQRVGRYLRDPWAARDDYVQILLNPSAAARARFLAHHQRGPLGSAARVETWQGLELQRHRLLMYASCGWFFDELSGLETVQVLRSAARVLQLARALGGAADWEAAFVARLAAAPSNVPELGTGDEVWRRRVIPAVTDLARVIAHYAIATPYEGYGADARVYAYRVERLRWEREAYGETALTVGRVRATSDMTAESDDALVAVVHFGGHDFHCALRPWPGEDGFETIRADLAGRFAADGAAALVRALDQQVGGPSYGVRDLFLEERRRLLARVGEAALARIEATYRQVYQAHRRALLYLREADAPLPDALVVATRHVLRHAVVEELRQLAAGAPVGPGATRVRALLGEARSLGLALGLDTDAARGSLEAALQHTLAGLPGQAVTDRVASALAVLALGRELDASPDLWAAQNRVFQTWRATPAEGRAALEPLLDALGFATALP